MRKELDTKCKQHPVDCMGCGTCPKKTIPVEEPTEEYIDPIDCVHNKTHLTDCDEDGYCNFCGHMDSVSDILAFELRTQKS